MFTPIRNLITYIQKNASGSTFFGGTSSNSELTGDTEMESNLVETDTSSNSTAFAEISSSVNEHNHYENNNIKDDNIIIKEGSSTMSSSMDDPLHVPNDEGEEEEKDIFLDFPVESENDVEFPVGEVIVLNDPDLNASMTSEPTTDPLAIDDYNSHIAINSPNPLESSIEGDVLFVDIERVVVKTPQLIDEVEDARQLAAVKATDEQELRSDGSDSGLGSETSTLQTTVTSIADTSAGSLMSSSPVALKIPLRSNLKRHIEDVVDGSDQLQQKKLRRSINFDGVKVFYFPRIQGHGCVPSQGGCTLGMGAHHISFKTFSLAEHAAEVRRAHRLQLQEINPRGSSSEESDSDEELSGGSESDLDAETNGFLQPVSPKQRRALLKAAGVRKIDASEKIECRDIRNSREVCGCVCRDFCDPETCACSQAGIKCQVDRTMFPCGCSRDACANVIGRIEFNPARVRTHFIHTIMRLDIENRQQKRSNQLGSELVAPASHLAYNSVPALANSTTTINTYTNPIPGYGLDPTPTASTAHAYHHHMHQQYNVFNNHMPPAHPTSGLCVQLSPSLVVVGTSTAALPQQHNHYANPTATEPDSLAMNGANLNYQDAAMYPPIIPPVAAYGDILAPFASSTAYDSAQVAPVGFSSPTSLYPNYPSTHQLNNHVQPPQSFLGYSSACTGELGDYNESHNSFISLNTPEACSSRLTAINDLLHNNRNTTAALVAIPPVDTNFVSNEVSDHERIHSEDEESRQTKSEKRLDKFEGNAERFAISERPDTPPDEENLLMHTKTTDSRDIKVTQSVEEVRRIIGAIPDDRFETNFSKQETEANKGDRKILKEKTESLEERAETLKEEAATLIEKTETAKEETKASKEETETSEEEPEASKDEPEASKDEPEASKEEPQAYKEVPETYPIEETGSLNEENGTPKKDTFALKVETSAVSKEVETENLESDKEIFKATTNLLNEDQYINEPPKKIEDVSDSLVVLPKMSEEEPESLLELTNTIKQNDLTKNPTIELNESNPLQFDLISNKISKCNAEDTKESSDLKCSTISLNDLSTHTTSSITSTDASVVEFVSA